MKDDAMTQEQYQTGAPVNRNDPAIDPQMPVKPGGQHQGQTPRPESADQAVDQKHRHTDNDNEFSPGFKPNPDRPKPSDDTDADIDTDGG